MQKHTSGANAAPVNVVLITLDNHMSAAVDDARKMLVRDIPNLRLTVHAATDWNDHPHKLQACKDDVARGNIIVASMLFIEEHVKAIGPDLAARREHCDAMMCCMSAGEIMKNTTMGRFKMDGEQKGPLALLKKLRGDSSKARKDTGRTAGERQMAMLKRLPKLLRFIPGTAQDVRNYFIAMQYRIAASDVNIANLVRLLVDKYSDGERRVLRGSVTAAAPVEYPDQGVYHPAIKGRVSASASTALCRSKRDAKGDGRPAAVSASYILSGDHRFTMTASSRSLKRSAAASTLGSGYSAQASTHGAGPVLAVPVRRQDRPDHLIDACWSLTGVFAGRRRPPFDAAAALRCSQVSTVPLRPPAHVRVSSRFERWEAFRPGPDADRDHDHGGDPRT